MKEKELVMKEFKVCYEIPRRPGHYIVPTSLTPTAPPTTGTRRLSASRSLKLPANLL